MINIERGRYSLQYSMDEPKREDAFEKSPSTIRFPSPEQIRAVQERRAVFVVPNFAGVIGIAEVWREVLKQEQGHTKASATDAFNDLLNQVFPALTANATTFDIRSASYALEEPIIALASTSRCNGGQLRLPTRDISGNH